MKIELATLLLLLLLLLSAASGADESHYSIPEEALRLDTGDLDALPMSSQLAAIFGNSSDDSADSAGIPLRLQRLSRLLRRAEDSSGRLLSFNRQKFFRGLLVVWVPISFVLPTLGASARGSSGGHGHGNGNGNELMKASGRKLYDPLAEKFDFDVHYGPLLSRLEGYFDLLQIGDPHCRRKLICTAAALPERYQPLTQLFRRLFERSQAFRRPEFYHPALKNFFTYYWANKKGRGYAATPDECQRQYSGCPLPVDGFIRTEMLTFWQKMSQRFAIQLQDE